MICSAIQQNLKLFLDDLLAEEEFQGFHAHLDICPSCRRYVEAVGSFSYQIKELSYLEIPADLESTIIFRLKKESEAAHPKNFVFKGFALFLTAALFFSIAGLFFLKKHPIVPPKKSESSVVITKEIVPGASFFPREEKQEESKPFIETQQIVAGSSAQASTATPVVPPRIEKTQPNAPAASAVPPAPRDISPAEIEPHPPLHWHLPYSEEPKKGAFLEALNSLSLQPDPAFSDLFILEVNLEQLDHLLAALKPTFPKPIAFYAAELLKFPIPRSSPTRLSIYLENTAAAGPNPLHWHLVFSQPNRDRLFDIANELGISLDYKSDDIVVFSVSTTKVEEFMQRIMEIEGVTPEWKLHPVPKGSLVSYNLQVTIHTKEK